MIASHIKYRMTAAAVLLACAAYNADAAPVGIASGQPTGTNYPMAEDIKRVCSTPTSPINNVVSDGSLANIDKIYADKNTQYGIIQADALEYQKGVDPKMMSRIVMVFPFFSTEIHLVAKDGSPITSLAQLEGKNVVEGPEGSGTWVTVQLIKKLTGISWKGFYASQKEGLQAVQGGSADAEFIVAGKPVTLLETAKGIKLVSVAHPALDKFSLYTKAQISAGTYEAQKTGISTYKVDNVLATYAYANQYHKEIGELVTCITRNIGTLQTTGHPKWKDVDPLDIDRITWPSHPAALAAIKREAKKK
jgi:TRAP transporter TAXI family solute receptor